MRSTYLTNRQWLDYLSPLERKQFIENVEQYEEENDDTYDWDEEWETFDDFINDGFSWGATEQGYQYWDKISLENREKPYKDHFSNIYVKITSSLVSYNTYFPNLITDLI